MHRTDDHAPRQEPSILDWAMVYHAKGWSVFPIGAGTKKPPPGLCWTRYRNRPADEARLRTWFARGKYHGLAVIFGQISGGLICRDFDVMEAYERWAAEHPDLANTLPTVATARGRHVYCRADIDQITAASTSGGTIIDFDDGELRGGGYCLLPPSRHPNGPSYKWLIPLPDGELPFVEDLEAAGFFDLTPRATERTERTETTEDNLGQRKRTEAIEAGRLVRPEKNDFGDLPEDVQAVILDTLPSVPGRRNRQVFDLARALKAVPRLADAPADVLEPYVRCWHNTGVARRVIGTEPFEETWIDFLQGWPKIRFPKGAEPMVAILKRARQAPLPPAAERYEQAGLRLLVALCRELQQESGDQPFFLACRTAGRLLQVNHTTAWRWLWLLCHDGVVVEVEKGDRARRRASRYRYRAE